MRVTGRMLGCGELWVEVALTRVEHSEFAHHHVLPGVPESGHNPGEHQGFSTCDPSGS